MEDFYLQGKYTCIYIHQHLYLNLIFVSLSEIIILIFKIKKLKPKILRNL